MYSGILFVQFLLHCSFIFSKACHSLIELALRGSVSSEVCGKEEAWAYYQDIMQIITKAKVKDSSDSMHCLYMYMYVGYSIELCREHIPRWKFSFC